MPTSLTRCKSAENIGRNKQVVTKFTIPEEPEIAHEELPKVFIEATVQTEQLVINEVEI